MNDDRNTSESPSTPPRWSWSTVALIMVGVAAWVGAQWQFTELDEGPAHVVASVVFVVSSLLAATVAVRRLQRPGTLAGGDPAPGANATAVRAATGRYRWRPPSTFTRRPQPARFWLVLTVVSVVTAVLQYRQSGQGSVHLALAALLALVALVAAVLGFRRLGRP